MPKADIIVVGAGVAGLMAAKELVAADRSVILLEANARVGGRLKRSDVAGRVGDIDGQWVGKGHTFLLDEAKRLGVDTYQQYEDGKTVMQLLGKVVQFKGAVLAASTGREAKPRPSEPGTSKAVCARACAPRAK